MTAPRGSGLGSEPAQPSMPTTGPGLPWSAYAAYALLAALLAWGLLCAVMLVVSLVSNAVGHLPPLGWYDFLFGWVEGLANRLIPPNDASAS